MPLVPWNHLRRLQGSLTSIPPCDRSCRGPVGAAASARGLGGAIRPRLASEPEAHWARVALQARQARVELRKWGMGWEIL